MITTEQVRTAIEVLNAYVREELSLDNDLLDDLERAIEAAWDKLPGYVADDEEIICDLDLGDLFDPPLATSA